MHLEAEDLRFVAANGFIWDEGGVDLEDDVMEGGTKVGAIDSRVAGRLWIVDIFAFGTVELDGLHICDVGQSHGEEVLLFAVDARTFAEVALLVLIELWIDS